MSVCLLALLGFPVFGGAGFWAKWYMIQAALRGGAAPQTLLVVTLVLTSVLSAGYYLYVVTVMFMRPRPDDAPAPPQLGGLTGAVIGVTVALILGIGFAPTQILRGVSRSGLQPPAAARFGPPAPGIPGAPTASPVVPERRRHGRTPRRRAWPPPAPPLTYRSPAGLGAPARFRHPGRPSRGLPSRAGGRSAARQPNASHRDAQGRAEIGRLPSDDVAESSAATWTPRFAEDARARHTGALLRERGVAGPVAWGRDNRPSGDALRDGHGRRADRLRRRQSSTSAWSRRRCSTGRCTTSRSWRDPDTGSHNPPEYNGFKMCSARLAPRRAIQRLYRLAAGDRHPEGRGSVRTAHLLDRYVDDVVARTGRLSRPLRVVADYGNGAGAVVGPQLLDALGARVTHLYAESDGTFPNHHPDPTVVENVQDLIAAVRARGADLGVAFDGDADRIGLVDASGEIVWGDHILILYARDVLARTGAGQSVIFDVKCSQALPDAVRAAGGGR
jgi:hypothetical protein